MVKIQKILKKNSEKKYETNAKALKLGNTYIRNLYFTIIIVMFATLFFGFFRNILLSISALVVIVLYFFVLFLYKKSKISFYLLKIVIYISTSAIIFFDFYINSTNDNVLYFFYYLVILSVFLYDSKDIFLFPLAILLAVDVFFAFSEKIHLYYNIHQIIFFNFIYITLLFGMYFFKHWQLSEVFIFDLSNQKEKTRIEYEKKLIAFAVHQIRTTINNFTIAEELSMNPQTSRDELERYKRISFESLCASLAVIENVSGQKEEVSENCFFKQIIKKIIAYYKFEHPNLNFNNNLNINMLINDTKIQLTMMKSFFLIFDIISRYYLDKKVYISIENSLIENNIQFTIKFEKQQNKDIKNNFAIKFLFDFLEENFKEVKAQYNFKEQNGLYILYIEFQNIIIQKEQQEVIKSEQISNKKNNYKVLLAEDDEINQKIYLLGLEKYFGEIDIAQNGTEVIKKLEQKNYDLVILDLQMPRLNGVETIKKIRNLEKLTGTHLPIIAITANTLIYNREQILNFGFDDYFIKPFKIKDLFNSFETLKKALSKTL